VSEDREDLELRLMTQKEELDRLRDAAAAEMQAEIDGMVEKIDQALDRIRQGTYGICASCGRPIRTQRLEAVPYATRCIDCQREDEADSRSPGRRP
jgi:DnaK suppressor protein